MILGPEGPETPVNGRSDRKTSRHGNTNSFSCVSAQDPNGCCAICLEDWADADQVQSCHLFLRNYLTIGHAPIFQGTSVLSREINRDKLNGTNGAESAVFR